MDLSTLLKSTGVRRGKKRVGRGIGSGKGGHTSGRGNKGQKARKGTGKPGLGFEGGQVPLYKRMPQLRGFSVYHKKRPQVVSLDVFSVFKAGEKVTPEMLFKAKIIKAFPKKGVKILAKGKLKHKMIFKGFMFSEAAKAAVDKLNA
jgi:large subunit ribosomal protein L15